MSGGGWKFHTRRRSKDRESKEFSHEEQYGASFETLEAFCFAEYPSIDSAGDGVKGGKSAIFTFINDHDFEKVELGVGEMTFAMER